MTPINYAFLAVLPAIGILVAITVLVSRKTRGVLSVGPTLILGAMTALACCITTSISDEHGIIPATVTATIMGGLLTWKSERTWITALINPVLFAAIISAYTFAFDQASTDPYTGFALYLLIFTGTAAILLAGLIGALFNQLLRK